MAQSNDLKEHQQTYGGFISLIKWTLPVVLVLTLIVVLLIA